MNQKGNITSFAVWKAAKIGGIVMACVTATPIALFIIAAILMRVFHGPPPISPHPAGSHPVRVRTAVVLLAVAPLFYGILGFLVTALASWLYNVLSPRIGGIEVELMVDRD